MKDIQRYDLTDDPIMETSNTGGWYKVSDVQSIIAQRDELLRALTELTHSVEYSSRSMIDRDGRMISKPDQIIIDNAKEALKG